MSKARHNIIPYNKQDLTRVSLTDLEDNDRIPSQKIAYVRYNDPKKGEAQWDIQSPEILLDNYGIPDKDGPYYQTNKQRAFLKVPLSVNELVTNETVEEREVRSKKLIAFKESLKAIDALWGSEEMKIKLFGSAKNGKKYTYQPIVRESIANLGDDSDSDSDAGNEEDKVAAIVRPDYMKGKIQLDFTTENVQLEIFQKNLENSEAYKKDGTHTEINVCTLDELRKHAAYMRKQRYVFHMAKVWASKQPANGQTTRMYGPTLKLRRIEVYERISNFANAEEDTGDENPFIESDDDEDEVNDTKLVKEFTQKNQVNADDSADSSAEEESADEAEDSDESDEEIEVKPPIPPPTPAAKGRVKKSTKNV